MKIGVLNDIFPFRLSCSKADGSVPPSRLNGDPLKQERLLVNWQELLEESLFLSVDCEIPFFVGDLVLSLGEEGTPRALTVWDTDKARVLYRYTAETGADIYKKEITLPIGEVLSGFVIEISSYFSSVDITGLKIYGSGVDVIPLFPTPASFSRLSGSVPSSLLSSYCANDTLARDAASVICERIEEQNDIVCVSAADARFSLATDPTLAKNAYRLSVTENGIRLFASDLRGFIIGAESLLKLIKDGCIPCCEIEDAPYKSFRGVHLMLPGSEEVEFTKDMIRHVISPMGYNTVILEFAGGMHFDSHPEINEALLEAKRRSRTGEWPAYPHGEAGGEGLIEKHEVAELVEYIRRYGLDVVPEVQSLGHVQFMTIAHPEIAEIDANDPFESVDELSADVPPDRFYPHCYCPSNERSYEILFDLMDEIIEVTKPREYVHIGHDEVYQIGVCEVCKDKDPAVLFANDVRRIYDHLKAKGLKVMMWADMVQSVSSYRTISAVDLLPKDILLLDFIWYFHMHKDIEDYLVGKGYSVAIGNLYSSHFPRLESRIAKDGIVGGQVSAWVGMNEYSFGKEGKTYEYLYCAQTLWSASYDSHLRLVYDRKLKEWMPSLRRAFRHEKPPVGSERLLYRSDLRAPYDNAVGADRVEVDATCQALIFQNVTSKKLTRIPWGELDTLGAYRVVYTDGGAVEIPIRYGEYIGYWACRQNIPLEGGYYRHNGYFGTYFSDGIESKTEDGTPVTVYRWEWRNPEPLRPIARVELIDHHAYPTSVVWLSLSAIEA